MKQPRPIDSRARPTAPRGGTPVMRWLGSLQLAVVLLPALAAVLFLGTVIESRHGRPAAAALVYRTWWFVALLGLLAVNIFFAAVKKWPWQRHQTGFIITHIGLLTLIAGGVWDSLAGTTGSLRLVTTADAGLAKGDPNRGGTIMDGSANRLRVRRPQRQQPEALDEAFAPGPLPWGYDGPADLRTDRLTTFLAWLRDPRPHGFTRDLGHGASIEVIAHLPNARIESYGPSDDVRDAPAVQFQLASPTTGLIPPRWISTYRAGSSLKFDPARIDCLGDRLAPAALREFLNPPASPGPKGQLVIGTGEAIARLDLASQEPAALGPWSIRLLDSPSAADSPIVLAISGGADAPLRIAVDPRQPAVWTSLSPGVRADFWVWLHAPDPRWNDRELRALLQFVTDADHGLHYRSYTARPPAGCVLEAAGPADSAGGAWQRIWPGMDWRFRITKYLPRAKPGLYCTPVDRPAGAESAAEPPAVRVRIKNNSAVLDQWVPRTDVEPARVVVGGEHFEIGYHPTRHKLGFDLTLLRAEQASDPGTGKPASLMSHVLLHDPAGPDLPKVISLNEPLAHRGYRVYQGAIKTDGLESSGKPVQRVQLLANRDPGVWPKYAGSAMVALGIACMFYMRAYFFKRAAAQPN